jgi:NCS1 family nucleobase:cation symporter-1
LKEETTSGAIEAMDTLYEFEREPVSEDKLQPGRYFAGLFAGEHVAGTEFVIGAMFVAWGVTAFDIFVGLLIGNLMAVLTWTFVCAPIAVRTRLTLYWFLRRVAGPVTTTIYNVLNAFLFCILAGCMITVSASAVRVPFGIPPQTEWLPTDFRFVLVVIAVGAVVVTLAILGFKKLAQFSVVCSPWMFLMFIAGAVALLPGLAMRTPEVSEVHSFADFWVLANKFIWTGVAPEGQTAMTFWQVAAFAWICNLAMHGGMSDMALFRYARKSSYGLYSACGMFLGHYLAWICAGVMGAAAALILKTELKSLDSGAVATQALGIAGLVAVVLAGWTTSNPTLYRAGLALQAVTPGWPRWLVTLLAGAATTVVACSPFVFTGLLNFVGYYGLLLMPVGAIAFTEYWIFPRIGFTQYWVAKKKLLVSWPALLSWGIAIGVALLLEKSGTLHLFFLFVPVWILTVTLYTLMAAFAGAREQLPELEDDSQPRARRASSAPAAAREISSGDHTVMWVSGLVALGSLVACLVLPVWVYLMGTQGYDERLALFKMLLLVPSLTYFVSGTVFMIKRDAMKTLG